MIIMVLGDELQKQSGFRFLSAKKEEIFKNPIAKKKNKNKNENIFSLISISKRFQELFCLQNKKSISLLIGNDQKLKHFKIIIDFFFISKFHWLNNKLNKVRKKTIFCQFFRLNP